MKTTTKIIIGLIAATYMIILIVSTTSLKAPTKYFQTSTRGILKTPNITAVQAFVSLLQYSDDSQGYVVELIPDDKTNEVTIDYPSEVLDVKMKGSILDILTGHELAKFKAENKDYEIVENRAKQTEEEEDATSDTYTNNVIVRIKLPRAMLLKLLADARSLNLNGGVLQLDNLSLDTFDFQRDLYLSLNHCNFKQATISVGSQTLNLSHTHIGNLIFYGKKAHDTYSETSINEVEGTTIDHLLLKTTVDMTLQYSCYKSVEVQSLGHEPVDIHLIGVKGPCKLK